MKTHLYLSLIPESLLASMLPPEEFGGYYATGTQRHSRGRAIFFEVSNDFRSDYFPMNEIDKRCVPHPDGRPRKSTYLGVYRVLEHVPRESLGKMYLVTADGKVLALDAREAPEDKGASLHLYQELCPLRPRVVSNLGPRAFGRKITDRRQPVSVDRIAFCELKLDGLAEDPEKAKADDLPYANIAHLRDCLLLVRDHPEKEIKTVVRTMPDDFLYRTVCGGFFVADASGLTHYPMPDMKDVERDHYEWWRSVVSSLS